LLNLETSFQMQKMPQPLPVSVPAGEALTKSQGFTDPLQQLLEQPRDPALVTPDAAAIVIGRLRSLSSEGRPVVDWPSGPEAAITASSLVAISQSDVGRRVALSFPGGATQPLVLGFLWDAPSSLAHSLKPTQESQDHEDSQEDASLEIDGEQVDLHAEKSLTLRCGKASITLTADGQILLKGAYISSHSTGTQRIKGAAVRIN
jgi:hypothetical protein